MSNKSVYVTNNSPGVKREYNKYFYANKLEPIWNRQIPKNTPIAKADSRREEIWIHPSK